MADLEEQQPRDWRLFNIICLGGAFMLMFTAFQTCAMVQESVLEAAANETNSTFHGSGYTSLAIIYAVFATANWIAPSVVAVIGPKWSMFTGGILYTLFIVSFLKPMTWALYTGSVLVGFGAAIIWTGQGNFLTINSDSNTVGRNSGIFWAMLQCSLLFGNLYVYFAFNGEVSVAEHTRFMLFSILGGACLLGTLLLLPLRKPPSTNDSLNLQGDEKADGPLQAFKSSIRLFGTKNMLLLSVCFAYTGFELTFFSGVYGTCVGHTQQFGHTAKSMIGLCGMAIGVGEILGGAAFGLFGKRTNKFGRDPIILFGFLVHMVAFYLIFFNLPADSPIRETMEDTYISEPNPYIAYLCAFLLGLGDSSFNTQIYSILGSVYSDDSASAFALYKFVQSLAAAGGFFYSQHLLLHWQLLIMVVSGFAGTICFFVVEWTALKQDPFDYSSMEEDVQA